jgi:hypothetical protein
MYMQTELEGDQGNFSNIKNFLSVRMQEMPYEKREFLHKTRLYYHETMDNVINVDRQSVKDVHHSRHIHLRGQLMGFTKNMFNLLPPGNSIEFKFTKANDRFYIIKTNNPNNHQEYKVEIVSALLHLTRVQFGEEAREEFMSRWRREHLYYIPYTRCDVSSFCIASSFYHLYIFYFSGTPMPHNATSEVTHNSKH